jgi:hypothetical protein
VLAMQNRVRQDVLPVDFRHVCLTAKEAAVPGLQLLLDFVSEDEERELLAGVQGCAWKRLARRQVCHFGVAFDYVVRPLALSEYNTKSCTFQSARVHMGSEIVRGP